MIALIKGRVKYLYAQLGKFKVEGAQGHMVGAASVSEATRRAGARQLFSPPAKRRIILKKATAEVISEEQVMNGMNPKVDFFFRKGKPWQEEFAEMRTIILDCGLTEELKWGVPTYTFEKSNIVLIHGFKEYCAILFVKGALLKDAKGVLIQQTENVQAARQVRFTKVGEIVALEATLKDYIHEAIENEKAGLKVNYKTAAEYNMPEEFINKLEQVPGLQDAFDALTPGRQKAYLYYFSRAKLSKTRQARIEKYVPQILNGKGIND